jgi:hypothetical protein
VLLRDFLASQGYLQEMLEEEQTSRFRGSPDCRKLIIDPHYNLFVMLLWSISGYQEILEAFK